MHVLAGIAHCPFSLVVEASELLRASCLRIIPAAYQTNRVARAPTHRSGSRVAAILGVSGMMELCARERGSHRPGRMEAGLKPKLPNWAECVRGWLHTPKP